MCTQYTRYAFICCLLCIYGLKFVYGQCRCCCVGNDSSGSSERKCNECYRLYSSNKKCECKIQVISGRRCDNCNDTCPENCQDENPQTCNNECDSTRPTDGPTQDGSTVKCPNNCNARLCNRECNSATDKPIHDDNTGITVVVVSCAVVIVVIAILITVCYWIRQSHKRDKRSKKHPNVKHDVQSGSIEIEDGGSVSNQPLPTIPVANHYTPEQSLNNTYEQIDPGYSSLKRNAQKPEYATLGETADDTSKKEASEKEKNRSKENSKLNTDGKGNDTVLSTTGGDSDTSIRQQEDAYSKLNRNSYINSVDDENSTYDKLITTPTAGDESEDCYSHLTRTSRNLEEDNPDYSKLEPVKGNTNDGYEETVPNLGPPPQEKEDRQCESDLDKINYENGLEGGKENGGYEIANNY